MSRIRVSTFLVCVLPVWLTATLPARQAAPAGEFRLSKIEVTGTKRYTDGDVVKVSGLQAGQAINSAALTAAAQRLAASGLFKSVKYKYVSLGTELSVAYDIEEESWTVPVFFDNFVWFGDEALTQEVRKDVPSFDGTAPANEVLTPFITRALQGAIDARRIQGRVEFMPRIDLKTHATQFVFAVKDAPALKMCALHLDGASPVFQRELQKASQAALGADYSRLFVADLAAETFRPMYLKRGYLKAEFSAPSAAPDPGCGGVNVTLKVVEGSAYAWDHAEWLGNTTIPASRLDEPLGMKSGEFVDMSKIEAGLRGVHAAYEKKGYLTEATAMNMRLDDQTHRAVFQMTVNEGPQYRMGILEFAGVSSADAASLMKKWRLRSGETYDPSYLGQFVVDNIRPLQGRGILPRAFNPQIHVDPVRQIVDVKMTFGAPPK